MTPGHLATNLHPDVARCNAEKKCPSRDHCRRYLDRPSNTNFLAYAAWEERRDGADRCDGFLPINTDL